MNLRDAELGREYAVDKVSVYDAELEAFLFSLGCYSGEKVTVISRRKSGVTVAIKDGRYSIDNPLAEAITVK